MPRKKVRSLKNSIPYVHKNWIIGDESSYCYDEDIFRIDLLIRGGKIIIGNKKITYNNIISNPKIMDILYTKSLETIHDPIYSDRNNKIPCKICNAHILIREEIIKVRDRNSDRFFVHNQCFQENYNLSINDLLEFM
jgi:hypothetical protein